jgi:uncharacterized DUF497 family protein
VPPTVRDGAFEWDAAKDRENQGRHGVAFDEAATAVAHPHAAVFDDGSGRGRLKAVGLSRRNRVLTVVFEPGEERDRIISAWKSTPEERRLLMTGGA